MSLDSTKELGFPGYWNKRYEDVSEGNEATHEWFRSFEKLRPLLKRHLPVPFLGPRIIHLGCGDSVSVSQQTSYLLLSLVPIQAEHILSLSQTLPADLFDLHYENQLSVDFSDVVIKHMQSNALWFTMGPSGRSPGKRPTIRQ